MTAPNHIAGGLFFAGFWSSFWNLNAYQKPWCIAVTIFSSLLADIDNPYSTLGKLFYPISHWLDERWGHRTITHSLVFLAGSTFIVSMLENNILPEDKAGITVLFFFGSLSHLLLDMLTQQGVPLLYPFRRNACVIPGRREYRLHTGDVKKELVIFVILCACNFYCMDLYKQGFWFTYNKTFTTIEHVHYERANAANFTLCEYHFIKDGLSFNGIAPVIDSRTNWLELFLEGKIVKLDYTTPGLLVKRVRPVKTSYPFSFIEKSFYNASYDSINAFCAGRIVSGEIHCTLPFFLNYNGFSKKTTTITLDNATGITAAPVPVDENEKDKLRKQLAIKRQMLARDRANFWKSNEDYFILKGREENLRYQLSQSNGIGSRNSIENELIKIKNKLQFAIVPVYTENIVTLESIRQLELQLSGVDTSPALLAAELKYINLPDSIINLK